MAPRSQRYMPIPLIYNPFLIHMLKEQFALSIFE